MKNIEELRKYLAEEKYYNFKFNLNNIGDSKMLKRKRLKKYYRVSQTKFAKVYWRINKKESKMKRF